MYCSNGSSSMATLLQQKNFMKTLSNNGGGNSVVDGTSSNTNGNINSQGMSQSSTTTNNTTHNNKMILPHELSSVPTTGTLTTSNNYNSNSFNGYQQPQQQHNHNNLHHHPHHISRHSNTSTNTTATTLGNHSYTTHTSAAATASTNNHNFYNANHNTNNSDAVHMQNVEEIVDDDQQLIKADQQQTTDEQQPAVDADLEPEPEIDIVINNVVCSFSVRCHLNLREIALNGFNVEFRRENGMVTMKLRRPYTTASIWSSGRITCTGATSEDQAKVAARRYARCLQKLGFNARLHNFRVVNVLGTCSMPWAIKIVNFSEKHRQNASYEPELHPGVTYKLKTPKATLKIFSTGSITVTAPSVSHVQQAIEHIFPLVYEFRKKRTPAEQEKRNKHIEQYTIKRPIGKVSNDPFDDIMVVSDTEEPDLEEEEEENM